jgi:hypothetical protein
VRRSVKAQLVLLMISLFIQGCSVARRTTTGTRETITSLWIKSFALTDCKGGEVIAKAGFRYIRDSVLLITMRNKSGIEGARFYIYKDSLFAYNRMKKTWYAGKNTVGNKEIGIRGERVKNDLIRRNTQKKYFEYTLGDNNKISVYIEKYIPLAGKNYIPGKLKIKLLYQGRVYCYGLLDPHVNVNVPVAVKRVKPGNRYKKVNTLNEVL